MKTMIHRRAARLGVIVAALLAAASVIVYATIPDASGVINGCYLTKDGSLRVIDPSAGDVCTWKETPIHWSQTGPQGLQGLQGLQGPQGPQGATGPSDAYRLHTGVGTNMVLCNQTACETTLGSISVPEGSYVITAKLGFANWSSTTQALSFCYLYAESPIRDPEILDTAGATTTPTISFVPASLHATATFFWPHTLALKCASSNGQTSAQNWKLIATKVGTVQ